MEAQKKGENKLRINKYLDRYLDNKEYKITIMKDMVNINNYLEIKDFSDTKIVIKNSYGTTTITGTNLVIEKMLDDEVLITGNIMSISL